MVSLSQAWAQYYYFSHRVFKVTHETGVLHTLIVFISLEQVKLVPTVRSLH